MLLLVQGVIFFKVTIPLLPSVTELGDLILHTSCHVINVAGAQEIILNDPESQSPITILLIRFKVRPCVQSLEDCYHIVPNQRLVGSERVVECTNFFRVSSKHPMPTENLSSINHLLIVCKVIASISGVSGIMCGNRSYQILPQPISEGFSIYSEKSAYVQFNRFQGLGPVPWIYGRQSLRVLVGFLHVPLMVYSANLGELNICVCECAPNPFEVLDVINHAL